MRPRRGKSTQAQRRVAEVSRRHPGGPRSPPVELFDHVGDAKDVSPSRDGRSIAFITAEVQQTPPRWNLFAANPDGSNVRLLSSTDKNDEYFGSVTWSADSRFVYFLRRNGSFWRVSAAGGTPTPFGNFGRLVRSFSVSRDGKQLIYGSAVSDDSIEIWGLDNALQAPSINK